MECRHEEYEDHDEVDRYCHPHDGYKCAGFRPDVRSSLWTYRRDCACTSPPEDDLPALRPTELCDVPAQASRHLWRILELRQYWRRQPGLQRDAAHLVGLDQKQRGRTEPPPSIFFCRRFSPHTRHERQRCPLPEAEPTSVSLDRSWLKTQCMAMRRYLVAHTSLRGSAIVCRWMKLSNTCSMRCACSATRRSSSLGLFWPSPGRSGGL